MSYITYHDWCKHLRDATLIEQSAGHLERLSRDAGVAIDRLKRWLAKDINLSHAEFTRLHEVLSETHVLGAEDATANTKESSSTSDISSSIRRAIDRQLDGLEPFDSSD